MIIFQICVKVHGVTSQDYRFILCPDDHELQTWIMPVHPDDLEAREEFNVSIKQLQPVIPEEGEKRKRIFPGGYPVLRKNAYSALSSTVKR